MLSDDISEIINNLRSAADYIDENGIVLRWGNPANLKFGQRIFTANTFDELNEYLNNINEDKVPSYLLRWIRYQQEKLLKLIIINEINNRDVPIMIENSNSRDFFVDLWIGKELLDINESDFIHCIQKIMFNEGLFINSIPIQVNNFNSLLRNSTNLASLVWDETKMVGFDLKNTVANFYSIKGQNLDEINIKIANIIDDQSSPDEINYLLQELVKSLYQGQSRIRQQITPRIYLAVFVYDDQFWYCNNKNEAAKQENRLFNDFVLYQMRNNMQMYINFYKNFARYLINKRVKFFKCLDVILSFPRIRSHIFLSAVNVMIVERDHYGNFDYLRTIGTIDD